MLEGLKEVKPNYGAWSTSFKYQKRPWSQNYPHYNEEGKGKGHQKRSKRTTAQEHSCEDKSSKSEARSKVPEPSGLPPPPKTRPSQKQELPAGSAPPGFDQLHKQLRPLETHGLPSNQLAWLRNTINHLRDLALGFWTKLDTPHAKATFCPRQPDYSRFGLIRPKEVETRNQGTTTSSLLHSR